MTPKLLPRYETLNFESFIDSPNVRAFIGTNHDYYKTLWTRDYERKGRNPQRILLTTYHWNWLALLGVYTWFGYRKMYLEACLWIALLCAFAFVERLMGWNAPGSLYIALNLLMLLKSKGLYFDHIVRFFDDNKNLPPEKLEGEIRYKGGTSTGWALAFWFGGSIAVALAFAAAGTLIDHHTLAIEPLPTPTMTG